MKEDILNEIKDKYAKVLEEKHIVALNIAIDRAYKEAYELGKNESETDKWKGIAERSTIFAENKEKENKELLAKIRELKDSVTEFAKKLEKFK